MAFRVTHVIDGNTFEVTPSWEWKGMEGQQVRANGYNTPEEGEFGYREAATRLRKLILGKIVLLRNPIKITSGRLLCDVYIVRVNLKAYFTDYQ